MQARGSTSKRQHGLTVAGMRASVAWEAELRLEARRVIFLGCAEVLSLLDTGLISRRSVTRPS